MRNERSDPLVLWMYGAVIFGSGTLLAVHFALKQIWEVSGEGPAARFLGTCFALMLMLSGYSTMTVLGRDKERLDPNPRWRLLTVHWLAALYVLTAVLSLLGLGGRSWLEALLYGLPAFAVHRITFAFLKPAHQS